MLVSSSDTAISNSQVTDERSFVGLQSGVWPDDSGRPTNPRLGKPGYNMASQTFEYWNGTDWSDLSPTQPGDIIWSARTSKRGHILCDGTLYDETTHPRLFSVIGRTYGGDENDGTFAVPDLSDRAAYGASGTKPLGTVSGSSEVTLTEANLPAHTHSIDHDHGDTNEDGWHDHGHRHNNRNGSAPGTFRSGQYGGSTIYEGDEVNGVLNNASEHTHTVPAYTGDSGSTGSDSPVTIEPPQVALNAFIKL